MRAFRPEPDGTISAEFSIDEVTLLVSLAGQLSELLRQRPDDDEALQRLLPDAYPDDEDASAEFRRFTADGLVERKRATASAILGSIQDAAADSAAEGVAANRPTELRLDPPTAQSWLVALGDLRLTIAARLGIRQDGDHAGPDAAMGEVYDWLGFVQSTLVEAMNSNDHDR